MKVSQMRNEVMTAYVGNAWKDKVKKMSDNQIIAIYHKLQRHNRFGATGRHDSEYTTKHEQLRLSIINAEGYRELI